MPCINQFNRTQDYLQLLMSKNFRSNLKMWLDKVLRSENTAKKEMVEIARKVANLSGKEAKNDIEDIITDHLFAKVEDLKSRKAPHQDAFKVIVEFLEQEGLQISSKLQANIGQYLDKYFTSAEENKRNYQDYVVNSWDAKLQQYDCICSKTPKDLEISEPSEKCYRCGRVCHVNCLWQKEDNSKSYECPFCYLCHCLPNKKVVKVLFAGYLRQNKKDKIQYKINLPLQITAEFGLIQSRCLRLSNNSRYEISWPQNSAVYLNNKKLIEYKPLPINSPLKRRTDQQIPLDRRLMALQNNTLIVQQKHQHLESMRPSTNDNHFIIVVAIKMITAQQMQEELLKQENRQSEAKSKECPRKYLDRGIQDCFIDKIKVKLQCQFYGQKITVPVRSKHCTSHFQPFDLKGFLFANTTNKSCTQRWKCPICKKRAYDLEIDQYLHQLINSNPNICEVFFNSHGQAQVINQKQLNNEEIEKRQSLKQQFVYKDKINTNQKCQIDIVNDKRQNERQYSFAPLVNGQQIEIINADSNLYSCQKIHSFNEYIELEDAIPLNPILSKSSTSGLKRNYEVRKLKLSLDEDQDQGRSMKKQKKDQMVLENNQKNSIVNFLQLNMHSQQKTILNGRKQGANNHTNSKNMDHSILSKRANKIKISEFGKFDCSINVQVNKSFIGNNTDVIQSSKFIENFKRQLIKASTIQIQSEDQSTDIIRLRKIRYLKQELGRDKAAVLSRQEKRKRNGPDRTIFNKMVQKYINSSNCDS